MAVWRLTQLFIGYKLLLFSLLFIVKKQYDTSSNLIFPKNESVSLPWRLLAQAIQRLVIWDSVFYVTVAERGIVYEHEWAFGRLWSKLIGDLAYYRPSSWQLSPTHWYGLVGICIALTSHYLATILLYKLTKIIFKRSGMAFATAMLYVFSPAGMFLVAGYSESTFALLSFIGMYFRERKLHIYSGIAFAFACGIRGNGVLWGIVFLSDLVEAIKDKRWKHALSNVIGGSFIAVAVIALQAYPYFLYCPDRGEWCNNTLPSIFTFVQSKYWNVGFLKYWTPNNIPNFLFGAPTILLLYLSARKYLYVEPLARIRPYLIVQLVILYSAIFVYHVQIITRIATCLPAMYWYGGELLSSADLGDLKKGKRILTYSICWGVAHGILFSAFLPPA